MLAACGSCAVTEIGRALRRQSYDLNEDDLFNVEYADVFGIPFDFTAKPVVAPPQPEFIADVIDMGNQKSADGMSGGPIFGYRMGSDGRSQYEVVAIQSQWNGIERIIACPVTVALAEIRATIRAELELDE